jgi:hypothetical protein
VHFARRADSRLQPDPTPGIDAAPGAQVVLPLTWWEARQGGRFAVAFPFLRRCDHCRGAGTAPPGICSWCGGSGRVADAWSLTLAVPPDLRTGDRLARRVAWPDGTHRELRILVRVR